MSGSQKKGWIRLHRKIEDNPLWFLEPFTKAQAWIDLFLNANHKDGIISIRGNIIHIKRGQIGWSELTMAKRWTWSKNRVRRFLKLLETEQQIRQQKDRYITTIITILKYEEHQSDTADNTAERQQKDSRRYINKNDKNEKNVKKESTPQNTMLNFLNSFNKKSGKYKALVDYLGTVGVPTDLAVKEVDNFVSYWTELNSTGTKQRWEMEKTFELKRRLGTWFSRIKQFNKEKKGIKL